jgi:hypothetical protein
MIARRDIAYLLATARIAMLQHLNPSAFKQSKSKAATAVGIAAKAAAAARPSDVPLTSLPAPAAAGIVAAPDSLWCSSIPPEGPGPTAAATAGFGDAALAALPGLLDDPVLLEELTAKWWGRCRALSTELCVDQVSGRATSTSRRRTSEHQQT